MSTSKYVLILLLAIMVISCGDVKKQDNAAQTLQDQRFAVSCKLVSDNFSKILEKDIEPDLRCMKENLDLFLKIVKTDKPGFLSQTELKTFIRDRMPEFDPENIKIIDPVFMVSNLIFGETSGYISSESLTKLIDFTINLNKELVKIYPFFKNEKELPYSIHRVQRNQVFAAAQLATNMLSQIFVSKRASLDRVNVETLINKFEIASNQTEIEKFKTLLFTKKLLFGGNNIELTHVELENVIYKIPQIATVVFDFLRYEKIIFEKEQSKYEMLSSAVDVLTTKLLFFPANAIEQLFTLDDVTKVIMTYKKEIFGDDFNIDLFKYRDEIQLVKQFIIGGKNSIITPENIYRLIDHAQYLLQMGVFYHRMYDQYAQTMASPKMISGVLEGYAVSSKQDAAFKADFIRIVNTYRAFKGDRDVAIYDYGFKRNSTGIYEIGMMEYIAKLIFQTYGCPVSSVVTDCFRSIKLDVPITSGVGGYITTKDGIINAINDFRRLLLNENIILPTTEVSTAENLALLSSLFGFQSNGNAAIEINEATELAITIFGASKVGDDLMPELRRRCGQYSDGKVNSDCFRKNIMDLFVSGGPNGQGYRKYFPNAMRYLDYASSFQTDELRMSVEAAANSCPGNPRVPIGPGDIMSFFVVIGNTESTIMRYDENTNNQLDPAELDKGFETYRPAVEGVINELAAGAPMLGGFTAKAVYRYLVINHKPPQGLGDYATAVGLGVSCPNCVADRMAIAAILMNVRNAFAAKRNYVFPCKQYER